MDLGNNKIGVRGIQDLSSVLGSISMVLSTLDLSSNCIGDQGVKHLADALKSNIVNSLLMICLSLIFVDHFDCR